MGDWFEGSMARRVVYYVAASLDGFIADGKGGVAWLDEFQAAESDFGYAEFYEDVGDIVLGRVTYEQLLGFDIPFPYADKPAWVLSSNLDLPLAADTVSICREPADAVLERLKGQATPGDIWLVGGGTLAGSVLETGMLDELRLLVMPVTLGRGVPLFGRSGTAGRRLERTLSREWPAGVMELRYAAGMAT